MLRCTVSVGKQLPGLRRISDVFGTVGITYLLTLCKITEDLNLQQARCTGVLISP